MTDTVHTKVLANDAGHASLQEDGSSGSTPQVATACPAPCPDCDGLGFKVIPLSCECCSDWEWCETCKGEGELPAPTDAIPDEDVSK